MDRADSGFNESYPKPTGHDLPSLHRSNTTPSRHRKSKKAYSDLSSNPRMAGLDMDRPSSERQSSRPHRHQEPRRKSIASSSENSTAKSRGRGHGSKPSSRRTSCTIVDPSRPARHYRIKSSQTVPTINTDIDDVLALHFRSCSLFQNPSYQAHSGLPSPTISEHEPACADADIGPNPSNPGSPIAPHFATDGVADIPIREPSQPKHSNELVATADAAHAATTATTIMHWTSPSTRRREYERIDKANNGFRGFVRRIIPRCVSGPPPERFYEKDASDVGSVRRYRMDTTDDENEDDEKSTSSLRLQCRRLDKSASRLISPKKKSWICF